MPLDPLATALKTLLASGSLAESALSASAKVRMAVLLQTGILIYERSGSGRCVKIAREADLLAFISTTYPSGLDGLESDPDLPRAIAIANLRNAKRAGRAAALPIVLRGCNGALLRRDQDTIDVGALTRSAGCAAVVVDASCDWAFSGGTVVLIENVEAFCQHHLLGLDADLAIYSSGPTPGLVLDWIASQCFAGSSFVHAKDYDPIGLQDYVRLKHRLGDRIRLYLPSDFEHLVRTYGKAALIEDSASVHGSLRGAPFEEVREVVRILDKYGFGLEQEVLLLQPAQSEGFGRGGFER